MNIVKKYIILVWMALCTTLVCAQLPVYTCDFEDDTENSQWQLNLSRVMIGLENNWFIGAPGNFDKDGQRGLYISSDRHGSEAIYGANSTMITLAIRDMSGIPQGKYRLYFDWKCGGKTNNEGLYVCWIPKDTVTYSWSGVADLPKWAKDYACDSVFWGEPQWSVGQVDIEHDGTPHKLVLLWYSKEGDVYPPAACVDNLELRPITENSTCETPHNLSHEVHGDTIVFSWEGNSDYYDIRSYDYINDTWFVYSHITGNTCDFVGITEGLQTFIIRGYCNDTTASDFAQYTQLIYHKGERCIDYMELKGNCYTGPYTSYVSHQRPFQKKEKIDYGYEDPRSRHTLHYIPNEYDPNTEYQLRTCPEGYLASVRLGDAMADGFTSLGTGNGKGEAIEYEYTVENADMSILKIKYALVLSNPNHSPEENPQFWLEVLSNGRPIANNCGLAFFTAGDSEDSGWLEGAPISGDMRWLYKPWTEHAINLRDYVGKTLTIRLVTTDCSLSGHTGYAYFVLDCESGEMSGLNCGEDNPTTKFQAPEGFDYAWYKGDDPANILSNRREFEIQPLDTTLYMVNVINQKNPNCWYTLSAVGKPRIPTPLATYAAKVQRCQNIVTFTNRSCVTLQNMVTERFERSSEPVTSLVWDFGDGTIERSTYTHIGATLQHAYPPEGGTFVVKLTAGLSNDACVVTDSFTLNLPDVSTAITEVNQNLCRADYPFGFNYGGVWWEQDIDSIFTFTSVAGCDSLCHLVLKFHDTEELIYADTICEGSSFAFFDKLLTQSGQYIDTTTSVFGCDSIVHLNLHVEPMLQINMQDSLSVCLDDRVLEIPYQILNGNMDSIIVVFDSLAMEAGFLPRYAFGAAEIPTIELPDSVMPDFYSAIVSYINPYCEMMSDTLSVELAYSSSIAQVKTNLLAVQNDEYNGGYAFDSIQWYKDGVLIPNATTPNLAVSAEDIGAEFTVKLRRNGEDVMIGSCPIVYLPTSTQSVYLPAMTWPLRVYNILGMPLGEMTLNEFTNLPAGIYLLSDEKNTVKVIL